MRLKKVKGAEELIEASEYILKNPKDYKGKFSTLFNNNNPICLEIGMGKGDFIIGMAQKYPEINFIGLEKFDSVIVRAIEKIEGQNISNLKLIKMDAEEINEVFDHEIDTLYLNFSDPWPKKRHTNRRLTSEKFLELYDNIFIKERHIIQKTDNRKLFEFSIMSYTNNNYKIKEISLDLYNDDTTNNVPTEYEKKFVSKGQVIYRIEVIK